MCKVDNFNKQKIQIPMNKKNPKPVTEWRLIKELWKFEESIK